LIIEKSWFEKWFSNKFYLKIYGHRNDEDARNLINLIQRTVPLSSGSKVLDIACGAGRHSIELARRGFDVTGFDLSKFLIGEAKKNLLESPEKAMKVKFLISDMRKFDFKKTFDLAVNIFTSFGYFNNDDENFSVIRNASLSLKKNGFFVFDFLNKKYLEKTIVPYSKNKFEDITVIQRRKIEDGFVRKKIVITKGKVSSEYDEVLKLYSSAEFIKAFKSYGLKAVHTFGDYYGNSFNENKSQRLIIIAKKL